MAALRAESARFVALAGSLSPADALVPVPTLAWSVGETLAHVLTVVRRGFADRRRSATAEDTGALNARCLEELAARDPAELSAMLRDDVHTAVDVVFPKIPDDRRFPFHGGVQTTMTPALHVVLGEFVVHGYDIARALGRVWPIPDEVALLLAPGELLGAWVRADAPAELYDVRLTGAPPMRYRLGPRRLVVEQPPADPGIEPDATIEAQPRAFVLAFYNRVPLADPALGRFLSRFVPS